MPDPRRFHPYYIIEAFSKTQNRIQEHVITREVEKRKRCQDLTEAKKRSIEFAFSLNERTMNGTSDWAPLLHLQTEHDGKLLIPLNLD
jgi:hypothetical protein|tara:strand:- start:231 stop:494 length:264 start_codon:yes stop_codon:yes gene_type:complete